MQVYAHTKEGKPSEHWQLLDVHLKGVANLAASFATPYGAKDWAYCAGLWHDIGKYQPEFQEKLRGNRISVEHSGAGAALAHLRDKNNGLILAFAIAGHHSGLANLILNEPGLPRSLKERLERNKTLVEKLHRLLPAEIRECPFPDLPLRFARCKESKENLRRSTEMWTRFIFSALVDADRIDTESFTNPSQSELRRSKYSSIRDLSEALDQFIAETAARQKGSDAINEARARVLQQCREVAGNTPGLFSLTAPTGSGKTLSAMSFALRHAEAWDLRRVIVVIPYTSIIEQNAAEYRNALGPRNVIEHHSNLDIERRRQQFGEEFTTLHDLAAENWDAPVVVTTSVQFFESLFSNQPSKCRKLHNIAGSVVILDEVQTVPPGFLVSIVDALNELVTNYGCTIVLSTATPPALTKRDNFESGLTNVRPIIEDFGSLNSELQRVDYLWPTLDTKPVDWPSLAREISKHDQVLTIVHRREDARVLTETLMQMLPNDSVIHLSALMCPAHRSGVLDHVRERLEKELPCRLVSTQLIEAGVDVDFPIVYRCLGGLDNIVQAGGRCNREGLLAKGKVIVFRAPTPAPAGTLRRALDVTESLLREHGGNLCLSALEIFDKYFRMLYATEDLDQRKIQTNRQEFNFASVGQEFHLIEDGFSQPIVVPYGQALTCLDDLRSVGPTREAMRKLQRYTVNVYPDAFSRLQASGGLEEIAEGVYALTSPYHKQYDSILGLMIPEELRPNPESLIV